MLGVGPACERGKRGEDVAEGVPNGIAQGSFVVVTHEVVVTKGVQWFGAFGAQFEL